jgi:FMN phosphatase YigB (HAD superfamily)
MSVKYYKLVILLFLTSFYSHNLLAEVHEIESIKEVLPYVTQNTLVIFDIDNTLVEPKGNLGSDQWFYYIWNLFKTNPAITESHEEAQKVWNAAQETLEIKPVEEDSPRMISAIQQSGTKVIAITARRLDLVAVTEKQLSTIGVAMNFWKSVELITNQEMDQLNSPVFMSNGIIYADVNNKALIIEYLMRKNSFTPPRVVFVDDKPKHVESFERQFSKRKGIQFFGFRYGATDAKVNTFNQVVGEVVDRTSAKTLFLGKIAGSTELK